ncbi:hypothetical protein B5K05_28355 [Rhizobium phaseoli]|nr:hypothetical protein B5K05_28355 [Rhizobium phaseoli]
MHQRLARWLLMCHDRLAGDVPVTHEFLAAMLGVRRSGITEHLHVLEGIHAIKSTRGNVRILDRRALIEVAGGCYGGPEAEYERLIVSEEAPYPDGGGIGGVCWACPLVHLDARCAHIGVLRSPAGLMHLRPSPHAERTG